MNRNQFLVGAIMALAFSDLGKTPFRREDKVPFGKTQRERQANKRARNHAKKMARKARKERLCEV